MVMCRDYGTQEEIAKKDADGIVNVTENIEKGKVHEMFYEPVEKVRMLPMLLNISRDTKNSTF